MQEKNDQNAWLNRFIKSTQDFPKTGICFKWYGDLLRDPEAFHLVIEAFVKRYENKRIEAIAMIEARGFIFGSVLAYRLKVPFVLIRKPGKLPGKVMQAEFEKEYGKDHLEMEEGAIKKNERVLLVDDLVATRGTLIAAADLIKKAGGEIVEIACFIELSYLDAKKDLPYPFFALISLDS